MKTFTSASANKQLKALAAEKDYILGDEAGVCTYVLAAGEEAEPPAYDYADVRARVAAIDAETLKIRHALHAFNIRTMLPKCQMTIDEALIVMAQLTAQKSILDGMRKRRDKERNRSYSFGEGSVVEYTYANYDIAQAGADYREVSERIAQIQLELDLVNQTEAFEADL